MFENPQLIALEVGEAQECLNCLSRSVLRPIPELSPIHATSSWVHYSTSLIPQARPINPDHSQLLHGNPLLHLGLWTEPLSA